MVETPNEAQVSVSEKSEFQPITPAVKQGDHDGEHV